MLWQKIRKGLSAGRVQSVAVKLIVEKEREIQAFVPEESWKISVELSKGKSKIVATLTKIDGKVKKLKSIEDAQKVLSVLVDDIKSLSEKKTKKNTLSLTTNTPLEFTLDSSDTKDSTRKP